MSISNVRRNGRPRKDGGLIWRETLGWCTRVLVTVDGERVRKTVELGTRDKAAARRKLAKLLAEQAQAGAVAAGSATGAKTAETADAYAEAWLKARVARTGYGATERQIWRDFWSPEIGTMPLGAVRSADIRRVLKDCADGVTLSMRGERLGAETVKRIRGMALRLFDAVWQDELIDANPVARVKLAKMLPKVADKRRAVLTDVEIAALLACPDVGLEIKMLVLMSRTIGGMRAGDLNTLDWSAFGEGMATCDVPRRKAGGRPQQLDVPEVVRPFLLGWWELHERPSTGPVFPVRVGKRTGEAKRHRNISYAARLRRDLRRALGVATWDGQRWVEKPESTYTARERELFTETASGLPVDFHSCRRAYSTALARANVNVQTAQVLTGHSDPKVHQRYVSAATIRALPEGAVPALDPGLAPSLAGTLPNFLGARRKTPVISVPRVRIELTTRGFSVHCSTN